ncbi:hypothetical protein BGW80DRAFT_1465461 [Lactifluus volemus]|nr:hypothetical protein BGW80DRAFT_1465461 [Lactifluus volemus]
MFMKTILALSFAALALAVPTPQTGPAGLGETLKGLLDDVGATLEDLSHGGT